MKRIQKENRLDRAKVDTLIAEEMEPINIPTSTQTGFKPLTSISPRFKITSERRTQLNRNSDFVVDENETRKLEEELITWD